MSLQVLFRSKAFGPGSDLWIVPDSDQSEDVRKMDWYLNFQLARAKHHKSQSPSPELRNILMENEWPDMRNPSKESKALMVAAGNFLPTQVVVMVPPQKQFALWVAQAKKSGPALANRKFGSFCPKAKSPRA